LIWVSVIIFYSLLISSVVISIGVVRYAYWLGAVAAALSVGLNYLLIPKYSYIGSAWVALICEIVLVGVTITYAIRHIGNIFRWKTWSQIIGLNLTMCMMINQNFIDLNILLKIVIVMVLYIFSIIKLRLLRSDIFYVWANKKIFSFINVFKK